MAGAADRFRERARECRELAPQARDGDVRAKLLRLARQLEEAARDIEEKEEGAGE